jgi:hypothetical protein
MPCVRWYDIRWCHVLSTLRSAIQPRGGPTRACYNAFDRSFVRFLAALSITCLDIDIVTMLNKPYARLGVSKVRLATRRIIRSGEFCKWTSAAPA